MTTVFYAIGDASTAFFKLMPTILKPVDIFFMVAGTCMVIGWIRHMIIKKKEEIGFNPTTEELNAH